MAGNTFFYDWEVILIQWLQKSMGNIGTGLAGFFTLFGEEAVLVLVFGLLYWCLDKKTARIIGTNLAVALIANPMIKNVLIRRRPYFDHETIQCLKPVVKNADIYDISAQGYSFPSAHSVDSCVTYGGLLYYRNKPLFRAVVIILIFLVGLSRVALGVHYPTDILAGWVLGISIVTVSGIIQSRIKNLNAFRLFLFILALPGVFFCRSDDYYTGLGIMAGFFLGIAFEERFVSFEETRDPLSCMLRISGGMVLFVLLNPLLKLPFTKEFLAGGTMPAYLARSARYMIIMFVLVGVYPMIFGFIEKLRHHDHTGSSGIDDFLPSDDERLDRQLKFTAEIDKMTSVLRRTVLIDKSRRENDAEHSWHIAVMSMLFEEYFEGKANIERVALMCVVHDLVEIYAGDTFAFDEKGNEGKADREKAAADRLFSQLPEEQGEMMRSLWEEFDAMETDDSRYAACLDRIQPFLHNTLTDGHTWVMSGATREMIEKRMQPVKLYMPRVYEWAERNIKRGEVRGWIR